MPYDWIKLCIKNKKCNWKSCKWILHKISNVFVFPKFIIKYVGVFCVVSPYLASHVLNLILHPTHNSYNGDKNTLVINSFILNIKPHHAWFIASHKILIINLTKISKNIQNHSTIINSLKSLPSHNIALILSHLI